MGEEGLGEGLPSAYRVSVWVAQKPFEVCNAGNCTLRNDQRKNSHHIYFSTIFLNSERRKKPGSPNSELLLPKTAADEISSKAEHTNVARHGLNWGCEGPGHRAAGNAGTWGGGFTEPPRPLRGVGTASRRFPPSSIQIRVCFGDAATAKGPPGRPALSPTRLRPGQGLGGAEQSAGLRLQSRTEDTVPSLWGPCPCPAGKRCPFPSETNRMSLRQDPAAIKQHVDQGRAHVLCKGPDRQSVGLWGLCSICRKPSALAWWQEGSPGCLSTHRQDWVPIKLYRP